MRNTDRVNSTPINPDIDKFASFVGMLATEINDADVSEHGIHAYDIKIGPKPHIGQYFFYLDLVGMTTGLGVRVITRFQVDTDRHDYVIQFPGLKNMPGIATSSELRKRLESDKCLQEVYETSTAEIELILEVRRKDYEVRGYVWEDQETTEWDENVIEVRTRFQDFEEKEGLWDILGHILETTQKQITQVYHREIPKDRTLFVLHLSEMKNDLDRR